MKNNAVTVTKAEFARMMGWKQSNQRLRFAERYGAPCGRDCEQVDLIAVIRAMAEAVEQAENSQPDLRDLREQKLRTEIRRNQEHVTRQQLENRLRSRELVPIAEIVEPLERMAGLIRCLGERIARRSTLTGREAQMMLNQTLETYELELAGLERLQQSG